jgi:hypothetical protein
MSVNKATCPISKKKQKSGGAENCSVQLDFNRNQSPDNYRLACREL